MFSYSSPDFLEAEIRYRRERTEHDWHARHAGDESGASLARRARVAFVAAANLRGTPRHHRHA
jgi:hypothetical protein